MPCGSLPLTPCCYCSSFLSSFEFQGSIESSEVKSFLWMADSLIPSNVSPAHPAKNRKLCFIKVCFIALYLRVEPLETVLPMCREAKFVYFLLPILGCPTHLYCVRTTVVIDRASNISDRLSSVFSILPGNYFFLTQLREWGLCAFV